MPARPHRMSDLTHIGCAICTLRQEVENRSVVPQVKSALFEANPKYVSDEPMDPIRVSAQARLRYVEGSRGDIQCV